MTISQKILGIGSLPPPRGGVSIFFERWIAAKRRDGIKVNIIDLNQVRRFNIFQIRFVFGAYDEILINNLKPILIIICKIIHPFCNIVAVDHNESRYFTNSNYFEKFLRWISYKLVSRIDVVSSHLVKNYQNINKLKVISSFFPPEESEFDSLFLSYDREIRDNILDNSRINIVISAWRPILENKRDLYGLMASVDLLYDLIQDKIPARLFIIIGDPIDNEIWRFLVTAARAPEVKDCIFIQTGQRELWPLLRCADVMLRLTLTDGNSVSIHEARWAGCEVVASNVVPRPEGVITYVYGDRKNLKSAVMRAVQKGRRAI